VFQENCLNYTKRVLLKKFHFEKNRPRGEIVVVVAGKTIEKEAKKVNSKEEE
jgi:16S rRNA (cytidine1402-2'-O)-methyltransferase